MEKPPLELAQRYVKSGKFLWNAAMFVWRVDALTAELRRLQREVHAGVREIAAAWESRDQEQVTARVWATLPNVTIDNGVMENSSRVAVVPAEMGWSDVGDWHGLGELIDHDDLGNSVRGDLVQIDTTNSVVWSESNRMVATVGMDNVIVVDTEDALLVIDCSRSQEVRKIVVLLKAATRAKLT